MRGEALHHSPTFDGSTAFGRHAEERGLHLTTKIGSLKNTSVESFFFLPGFFFFKGLGVCLTWPVAKRLKLFGITYLVGKMSSSNFFFRVFQKKRQVGPGMKIDIIQKPERKLSRCSEIGGYMKL